MEPLSAPGAVAVIGASGFIGSAVVRALLRHGADVRAIVRPGSDLSNLRHLPVKLHEADVCDARAMERALEGSAWAFHLAAKYRFGRHGAAECERVNVLGTRVVLEAARRVGLARMIYTSTVGTLGLAGVGGVASEDRPVTLRQLRGPYKGSKYVAEHEALRAAAAGAPVVLVQPTFPVGVGDRSPTPSGRLVLDFLNGRLPAFVETGLNVVDVDDVAEGQLLAAARGRVGRSYILGGENLTLREMLARMAALSGLPAPRLRLPPRLLLPVAVASEGIEGNLLGREPSVPLEALHMSMRPMFFDDGRARRELGYRSRSASEALRKAIEWFVAHGFVRSRRVRRMAVHAAQERPPEGSALAP